MKKIQKLILVGLFIQIIISSIEIFSVTPSVDTTLNLSEQEISYINKRKEIYANNNNNLNKSSDKNIALCLSGGGYRAMICAHAVLKAMEDINLLKKISHISTVSGSTWGLINILARDSKLSQEELKDLLKKRVININFFDPKTVSCKKIIKKLLEKYTNNIPLNPVDFWGALLAEHILGDIENNQDLTFNTLRKNLTQNYYYPFPIFCSVITEIWPYSWIETNPFTTMCEHLKGSIPTYSFDSIFSNGTCKKLYSEESLGTFMGLFGSPYCISFGDIIKFITAGYQSEVIDKITLTLIKKYQLYQKRFLPSYINNFVYDMPKHNFNNQKTITIADAGLDFNLALPPLLNPKRKINKIIIFDTSSDALRSLQTKSIKNYVHPEMQYAYYYAQRNKLKFPPIDNPKKISNNCFIFKDKDMTIIYITNPIEESTLKFNYSEEEFEKLYNNSINAIFEVKDYILKEIEN